MKYKLHGKYVSKGCMKSLINERLYDKQIQSMDIDEAWDQIHDPDHNITDRLLVIDIFNALLRKLDVHAFIHGNTINQSVIKGDNPREEIRKYKVTAKAICVYPDLDFNLPFSEGPHYFSSFKDAYIAINKYKAQLEMLSANPYKSIRFIVTGTGYGGYLHTKTYEYIPGQGIKLLRDDLEIEHDEREKDNLPKMGVEVKIR